MPSRRSTQGYTYDIGSGTLSWASKLQATTSLSTCEAEYKALAFATKEAVWLARLLNEITNSLELERPPTATIIYGDNQGSIALAKNPVFHARTKYVDVQHHFVREKVASGEVELQFVSTKNQIADGLTKALPKDSFYALPCTWYRSRGRKCHKALNQGISMVPSHYGRGGTESATFTHHQPIARTSPSSSALRNTIHTTSSSPLAMKQWENFGRKIYRPHHQQ
jgi:hypothetical protein